MNARDCILGRRREILFSLIPIKGAFSQEVYCFEFIINLLKKDTILNYRWQNLNSLYRQIVAKETWALAFIPIDFESLLILLEFHSNGLMTLNLELMNIEIS